MFSYARRVAFSDTDAMGVVHHANYLRYCEESRVAWMRETGLSAAHYPQSDRVLAVINYQVWHFKPARFEDLVRVSLQVRRVGARIHFQYLMKRDEDVLAHAETWLVAVDDDLKPARLDPRFLKQLEKEKWTETWLSNS